LEFLFASDRNPFAPAQLLASDLDLGAEPVPEFIAFNHQPQRLADDFTGVVIKSGVNLVLDPALQFGSEGNVHTDS
jgi:hypothetical protein